MDFPTVSELKEQLRITNEETEFDNILATDLGAAKGRVLAFLNRPVVEALSNPSVDNEIEVNESIKSAILNVAGYSFDNTNNLDEEMIRAILKSCVGHLRLKSLR